MNTIHLNIGLNINGIETLQMPQIAVALEAALPGMEIQASHYEHLATAVAPLDTALRRIIPPLDGYQSLDV